MVGHAFSSPISVAGMMIKITTAAAASFSAPSMLGSYQTLSCKQTGYLCFYHYALTGAYGPRVHYYGFPAGFLRPQRWGKVILVVLVPRPQACAG